MFYFWDGNAAPLGQYWFFLFLVNIILAFSLYQAIKLQTLIVRLEIPNLRMHLTYFLSHLTSAQVMLGSNRAPTYSLMPLPPWEELTNVAFWPTKLAMVRCGGRANLLRASACLMPNIGASTVNTRAVNPAASARRTKFRVTSLQKIKQIYGGFKTVADVYIYGMQCNVKISKI